MVIPTCFVLIGLQFLCYSKVIIEGNSKLMVLLTVEFDRSSTIAKRHNVQEYPYWDIL